ncbi:GNAT family N-acetyltransferase [Legionella jamestowniensis]|nr:GNAT family N-acetyltransferase [Legionella jamestowniensis]
MNYTVVSCSPKHAEELYQQIAADFPEHHGLYKADAHSDSMPSCTHFKVTCDNHDAGLLSLSFPYPATCHIDWIGVLKRYQGKGFEHILLQQAFSYATQRQAKIITVETLAPFEADANYPGLYPLYEANRFYPLFNRTPQSYAKTVVYMAKSFYQPLQALIEVEQEARQFGFDWPNEMMILEQAIDECNEIQEAIAQCESKQRVQEEIGDLLHTAISLCLFAGFDVEETLTKITHKFTTRFQALKEIAQKQGFTTLKGQSLTAMMALWRDAKEMTAQSHNGHS